jgi:hypothetical protein
MTHYFIDKRMQPDGPDEVDTQGCSRRATDNRYLGDSSDLLEAMMEAPRASPEGENSPLQFPEG